MGEDWRERHDRELEQERWRGQMVSDVRGLSQRIDEIRQERQTDIRDIREGMKSIQQNVEILARGMSELVPMKKFEAIESTVAGLTSWKIGVVMVLGVLVFLSQVLPKVMELLSP